MEACSAFLFCALEFLTIKEMPVDFKDPFYLGLPGRSGKVRLCFCFDRRFVFCRSCFAVVQFLASSIVSRGKAKRRHPEDRLRYDYFPSPRRRISAKLCTGMPWFIIDHDRGIFALYETHSSSSFSDLRCDLRCDRCGVLAPDGHLCQTFIYVDA